MLSRKWFVGVTGFFGTMAVLCSCSSLQGRKDQKATYSYSQYMKGLLSDRQGELNQAVAFYRQAQTVDRETSQFHFQLGVDYFRLGKYKKAISEFKKVVDAAPDDDNARYVLALLYIQVNDFKKAAGQYEGLLAKNLDERKQNIQLRRILSQLYFLDKDFSRAREQGVKILTLDPVHEYGLYLLAILDSEEGYVDKARAGFEKVLIYYPGNTDAMNALAYLFAEQGIELVWALNLAEKAVVSRSSDAAYLDTLGWVHFKLGDIDEAIGYLEKALKLLLDPVISDHLKQAYQKKGSRDAGYKKDP